MELDGNLTKPQKAAAILVAMGKTSAGRLLRFFKQDELKALIGAARALKTIPQSELERIVAEFEEEFTEGAGLLDSADQMDTLLNESLSPEEIGALMGWSKPALIGEEMPPVWPELAQMEADKLGEMIASEHPQTIAFILSNLESQQAANVLLTFPKSLRSDILKRMLTIRPVQPAARQLLENQLRQMLAADSGGPDISAGQNRVAGLLNEMDKSVLDELLDELEASGVDGLAEVKAKLFSFDDIVLLEQKDRVTLFDGISTEVVTLALRNASPEMAEAVLSAIGARSRRMIESELATDADNIKPDDIGRARKQIATAAIGLASTGAIELPTMQSAA